MFYLFILSSNHVFIIRLYSISIVLVQTPMSARTRPTRATPRPPAQITPPLHWTQLVPVTQDIQEMVALTELDVQVLWQKHDAGILFLAMSIGSFSTVI